MTQSQFSLSWGGHKTNICTGLSTLQQNGEFVDMTLAADGHHVKVHQVIMALASPYIKELIASAQCPHPVIFLNKISYNTLSAILEYIYTGEVLVAIENFSELVEAGKELHIKGLDDMNFNQRGIPDINQYDKTETFEKEAELISEDLNDEYSYFEVMDVKDDNTKYILYDETENNTQPSDMQGSDEHLDETVDEQTHEFSMENQEDEAKSVNENIEEVSCKTKQATFKLKPAMTKTILSRSNKATNSSVMQYTVSNQGSLQMILNRFVYYLKHTNRDGTRQWRCVDYLLAQSRCPAIVFTNDDIVTKRLSAHTHMFHDKKILKKVKAGAIYTAIQEAIKEGDSKKVTKPGEITSEKDHSE